MTKITLAIALLALTLSSHTLASQRYIVHWQDQPAAANVGRTLAATSRTPATSSLYLSAAQLAELAHDPQVQRIELDPKRELLSLASGGDYLPYGLELIQALSVSDRFAANQRICIIDSGIDGQHPDFDFTRIQGLDDAQSGSWRTDAIGHGTHVAGTLAALANGQGLQGILPNAQVQLIIVKAFNESGWAYSSDLVQAARSCVDQGANIINMSLGGNYPSSSERLAFAAMADQGILLIAAAGNDGTSVAKYPASYDSVISVAAVDQQREAASFSQRNAQVELSAPGVAIWSASLTDQGQALGSGVFSQGVDTQAVAMQGSPSASVTAATAFCGLGTELCQRPEPFICVMDRGDISFAAKAENCAQGGGSALIIVNNNDQPLLGHLGGYQSPIPVWAVSQSQGQQWLNTAHTLEIRQAQGGNHYRQDQGTSMAAPHVSGAAALVWSHFPTCHGQDIRAALAASAQDLGVAGRDHRFGFGLINTEAALALIAEQGCQRQYWLNDQWQPSSLVVSAPVEQEQSITPPNNGVQDRSSEQIAQQPNRQTPNTGVGALGWWWLGLGALAVATRRRND